MNAPYSKPRLFLIDGYGYVFRAFYALPPLVRKDGFPTNAISGFCNMLFKLLGDLGRRVNGEKKLVAVALDTGKPTFRHEIYKAYKENRPQPPEALILQFPVIRLAIEAFDIPILEAEGYEADDLICTYALAAQKKGIPVTIVSADKDLAQLLAYEGIELLDGVKFTTLTMDYIQKKYGVQPHQLTDMFALVGDASDNVPGVPGIGPKTAAQLIQAYGTLENLYQNIHEVPKKWRQENLKTFQDQAFLSKKLIQLDHQAPMPISLDAMPPVHLRHQENLMQFLEEMELFQLAKRIVALKSSEPLNEPILLTQKKMLENLDYIIQQKGFFSYILGQCDEKDILLINGAYTVPITEETQPFLKNLFEHPSVLSIGYNVKKNLKVLHRYALAPQLCDDVMLMAYSCDVGLLKGYQLQDLYEFYGEKSLLSLWETLKKRLTQKQCHSVYYILERPMIHILARMEEIGISIDRAYLEQLSEDFEQRLQALEQDILAEAGVDFNLASPKQLGEVLFEKLGYSFEGKTKTGAYRTDSEALETLALQGKVIAQKILTWRMLSKLKNTYTDPLRKFIQEDSQRIHPTFILAGTNTGRLACQTPNLQNIPIRTQEGQKVRQCFKAKEGYRLLSADYNQIELRLLAHIADVPNLKKAFEQGVDIHTRTASEIFSVDESQVDADLRRKAKAVNFGIIYGLSAFGLARQLGIEQAEAKSIIEIYFSRFPEIQHYMESCCQQVQEKSYVQTLMGRKIHFPKSLSSFDQKAMERAAINAPIQGSAADILRLAMLQLDQKAHPLNEEGGHMLLQIHDELLFEVPIDKIMALTEAIKHTMTQAPLSFIPLSIELVVHTKASLRWGSLEKGE